MHGRKTSSGSRLDQGTGLSKPSVIDGLKSAVQHGYLAEEVDRRDAARIKKSYMPKMRRGESDDPDGSILAEKNLNSDVKNLYIGGKASLHRTEKDTIERKTVNRYENSPGKQQGDNENPQTNQSVGNIPQKLIAPNGAIESTKWVPGEHQTVLSIPDTKTTVNRSNNPIEALPKLDQDEREQHATVAYILDGLGAGERKSEKFFFLIASRIPRKIIETHLSGILHDGAKNPAALFTYRMTK